MRFIKSFFLIFLVVLSAHAQKIPFNIKSGNSTFPVKIIADRVLLQQDKKYVEACGRVYVFRGKNWFRADYLKFFWKEKRLYLKGNAYVQIGRDYLKGNFIFVDLNTNTGWVKRGEAFFYKSHLYFKGEKLEKTGDYTYWFKDVRATSCDQSPPPWSIKAKRGYISKRGYAHLWGVRFCVKEFPVLYSPYLLLPAKRKRESGFLFPEFKFSSRNGFEFNLPYYQVISEEQDFTFYTHYIGRRGYMFEGEYRTFPNPVTKGFFWLSWLRDRIVADSEAEEFNEFKGDGLIRPNKDRYWLRGKLDGFLFDPSLLLKLDIDVVSDQNYIREFDSRFTGFDKVRATFLKEFGRDIDKRDSITRRSVVSVSRDWLNFGAEVRAEYTQNLRYFNHNRDLEEDPTVQRIPEVNLYLYPYRLGNSSFQLQSQTTLSYLWRRKGISGERINIVPSISYEYINPFFRLTPKITYHEIVYLVDNSIVHNSVPEFNVNFFTEFSRIFEGGKNWQKIRHILKPEISYTFIPQIYQDNLPHFDGRDRISPVSKLTYSITNLFTSKIWKNKGFTYLDFLYLKIEQSYDFMEASREKNREIYPRRPFSDIKAQIKFRPANFFSFTSDTWFSPYVHKVTEHESSFKISSKRLTLSLGYDYARKLEDDIRRKSQREINDLKMFAKILITSSFSASYQREDDFIEGQTIKQIFTFTFTHQCWNSSFVADIRRDDRRFMILINLNQLGGLEQVVYRK